MSYEKLKELTLKHFPKSKEILETSVVNNRSGYKTSLKIIYLEHGIFKGEENGINIRITSSAKGGSPIYDSDEIIAIVPIKAVRKIVKELGREGVISAFTGTRSYLKSYEDTERYLKDVGVIV